jgi:acyl carrier protein
MNQTDVIARLQTIFDAVFLEPVVLTPAISAKDVPEWDSLTHISLMVAVEKAFNVRFRVGEVENAKNIGEFADLILKRMQEHSAGPYS